MIWWARKHWQRGDSARDQHEWDDARDAYQRALRWAPHRSGVWVQLGHVLRRLEQFDQAVAAYRRAIDLAPTVADTYFFLGQLLIGLKREDEARDVLQRAVDLDPNFYLATQALAHVLPRDVRFDRVGYVIIGTTGLCNASCIHCPTGKDSTAHVPRTPMAMALFERLLDELADLNVPIYGQIAFGLFGDALVDPHVVRRLELTRARFPQARIAINTNGAAYNRARHQALREFDPIIALHCESLQPAIFDHLMAPLRLERVLPKIEQILEDFAGSVHVSIPASRANLSEIDTMTAWFESRRGDVVVSPLASRCVEDRTVFNDLAFAPSPVKCNSRVLDDLVIDSDGTFLGCCQDFRRLEVLGDLRHQSMADVVFGARRAEHARLLDEGRHCESGACSNCFADAPGDHRRLLAAAHTA